MINIHLDESNIDSVNVSPKDQSIKVIAQTKDISWGGFCLQFPDLPQDPHNRFSPEKAHSLVGRPIKVTLTKPSLTLWGDIIRFDSKAKQMAIVISKASDYELWQELCEKETAG